MRTGTLGFVVGLFLTSTVSAQHFTDIWVGQTPDGQLSLGGISLDRPIVLAPVDEELGGALELVRVRDHEELDEAMSRSFRERRRLFAGVPLLRGVRLAAASGERPGQKREG